MGSIQEPSFSGAPEVISAHGLLFDFDGTIIDSTEAIVKHWHIVAKELGVDPEVILASSHGRRSIDILNLYDPSKANWEYVQFIEGRIPKDYSQEAVEIPGARRLLTDLNSSNAPWAVVTSGTRPLVNGWVDRLRLAPPKTLVTAEDVENGKPDPACYRLGQKRLGFSTDRQMIVFEDAPSGIKAGKAAGFKVLAVATTHTIEQIRDAGADWVVRDLTDVSLLRVEDGSVHIEIRNSLVM